MTAIRGVVFDFYGTLVRMVPPLPPSHQAIFNRRGLVEAGERWGDQWSVGPAEGEEHSAHSISERTYLAWERDRLRRRAHDCQVPGDQVEDLVTELDGAMKDIHLALFEDVLDTLAALRAEGALIAVCSNWYWHLDRSIADVGLAELIDVSVSSAQAGARKPHPLIYRTVLDRCGLDPGETLFVGDIWRPDVVGPLAAGMRAVHLWRPDRAVRTAAPPLVPGAVRIAGLRELIPLL
ncbi:HAD family hydrolase [Streptomyces albipurpureus]|uniref:HAD family hydrolase n=1 Tax=Streptomyces albipurpureus TaxID=2897419 RepID=A0ABT0UV22_9ACTN|nr:HAD family hydrolase [Streptomyces sp. CWNU-1]MCM2392091.1 HAD family hydrolase [Streptomyces sp. CWNU-1]